MIPLGFIVIALFIARIVYVKNSDAKLVKELREKSNLSVNYKTINDLNERKIKPLNSRDITQLESMMEQRFEVGVNNSIKKAVDTFGDNSHLVGLVILESIGHNYKHLKEIFINEPKFNKAISQEAYIRSLNKVRDRIKSKYLE
jgi:hypothetical protein